MALFLGRMLATVVQGTKVQTASRPGRAWTTPVRTQGSARLRCPALMTRSSAPVTRPSLETSVMCTSTPLSPPAPPPPVLQQRQPQPCARRTCTAQSAACSAGRWTTARDTTGARCCRARSCASSVGRGKTAPTVQMTVHHARA